MKQFIIHNIIVMLTAIAALIVMVVGLTKGNEALRLTAVTLYYTCYIILVIRFVKHKRTA